jgi:hypothetical protein
MSNLNLIHFKKKNTGLKLVNPELKQKNQNKSVKKIIKLKIS